MHVRNRLYMYSSSIFSCGHPTNLFYIGFGAAYGTAKSGVGIASMGVLRPDLIIKNVVPVIMAGIIGIYGLVVAVLVSDGCISPILFSFPMRMANVKWHPYNLCTQVSFNSVQV